MTSHSGKGCGPSKKARPPRALPEYEFVSKLLSLPVQDLIATLARAMEETMAANKRILHGKRQERRYTTRFHARDPPPMAMEAYLTRLQKFTPYSLDALLLAMVYISRITHRSPPTIATSSETQTPFIPFLPESTPRSSAGRQDGVAHRQHDTDRRNLSDDGSELPPPPLTPWTGHRLLLASLHIASSYISDAFIPLQRAAKVGGISATELHQLQVECFELLNFQCAVAPRELESVARALWETTEKKEASVRIAADKGKDISNVTDSDSSREVANCDSRQSNQDQPTTTVSSVPSSSSSSGQMQRPTLPIRIIQPDYVLAGDEGASGSQLGTVIGSSVSSDTSSRSTGSTASTEMTSTPSLSEDDSDSSFSSFNPTQSVEQDLVPTAPSQPHSAIEIGSDRHPSGKQDHSSSTTTTATVSSTHVTPTLLRKIVIS